MNVSTTLSSPSKTKLDALILALPEFDAKSSTAWKAFPSEIGRICKLADPTQQFSGKDGSVLIFPTLGQIAPSFIALVGLGKSKDISLQRRTLGKAVRQLQKQKVQTLGFLFADKKLPSEMIVEVVEEASYHFKKFSPNAKEALLPISKLVLFISGQHDFKSAQYVADAVRYTRDIANQPPNYFHPDTLAQEAQKLARKRKLKCQIWDKARLQRDGFGGILAVGQGSAYTPRFIRLDYRGGSASENPFVIVGKAITFDTGGISIKPSDKMDEMKFDKCGGIAVLGILEAIAALRLPINVTGLISSAENMPSSTAYRPGDLIPTLSGKYVEVLNTDAEGRIVLADALTYAQRLKPKAIVDLATLTGACIICFGHECAALLGNDDRLIQELRTAADRSCEKAWPLPIWPEYQEKVKSDVGFVKNTAGREGGTITAACFLNSFIENNVPWAHIDIAGVAWTSNEQPHRAKGATAFGVRLVTEWLKSKV
jgi:leucyl aminopeptidase